MIVAGRLVAARAEQEVEVGAAVGLEHMVDVGGCCIWAKDVAGE